MTPLHGTNGGAHKHRRHDQPACPDCAEAQSRYVRAWRIRTGRTKNIVAPIGLLKELTMHVPPEHQTLLEDHFGHEIALAILERES